MSDLETSSPQAVPATPAPSNKEYNFELLRKQLEKEKEARLQAEQRASEYERSLSQRRQAEEDDDDDSEPYVDNKRLERKLSAFERNLDSKIEKKAEEKARFMMQREKQENWMRQNPDFYDVLQHAETFANADPELADTILQMPEGFERQKLVYKTIKAMGLHKKPEAEPSIQQKIDANRRSPFYQPGGQSTPGYNVGGDFSKSGQKSAYEKMKELKARLGVH